MDAEQPVSKSIRGSTWSDKETRYLLNIWSEQKIQEELDNSTRNTHVYSTISRKMGESGFNRPVECRQRIKTLKKNYFQVKNSNKSSGQGRVSCRYYDEIDRVLVLFPLIIREAWNDVGPPRSGTRSTPNALRYSGSLFFTKCVLGT